MSTPEHDATVAAVAKFSGPEVIVCYQKCWPCNFGQHYDAPEWHTWADDEDIEAAEAAGQPDPTKSRCGCYCAVGEAVSALDDEKMALTLAGALQRAERPPSHSLAYWRPITEAFLTNPVVLDAICEYRARQINTERIGDV